MPRIYSEEELTRIAAKATQRFVEERHAAEYALAEQYHEVFARASMGVAHVMQVTDNLEHLREKGTDLLTDGYLDTLRSMVRPTVSEDDFKNLSSTGTTGRTKFHDPELSAAALDYVQRNLNLDLFPWLEDGEEPSASDIHAASVSIAALMAEQRTKTAMRGGASHKQESLVKDTLAERCHYKRIVGADFDIQMHAPRPGELFDGETKVADTKADVVFGLYDGRFMCLECKVSNSEVNSFKRLNHEAVEKTKQWESQFGKQCVSGAVLKGCFKPANLLSAQESGTFLFWSDSLDPLVDFVERTRR